MPATLAPSQPRSGDVPALARRSRRRYVFPQTAVTRESSILWGLIVAFLVTLFVPKQIALQVGSLSLTPALTVSLFLLPSFLVLGRVKWAWCDGLVVAHFVAMLVSMSRSAPMSDVVEAYGRMVLISGGPYIVGRYLGTRPRLLRKALGLLITLMAVFAAFVILESLFRFNIHALLWQVPYRPHEEMRLGLTRAHGWTQHSIMMGVSYAVIVPVALMAALEKMNLTRGGGFRGLKAGLLFVGVFCSLSTGAYIAAALGVFLVVWDRVSMFRPGMRWALLGLGGPALYWLLDVASGRPLLRILMSELHLSDPMAWHYRWKLYERVYALMPGKWWFGWGIEVPPSLTNTWAGSIDNNYLCVLLNGGRVGLVIWLALTAAVLLNGWKLVWKAPDTKGVRLARAIMFSVAALALTQLTVAMFSMAANLNWLFLGLAVGVVQGLRIASQSTVVDDPPRGGRRPTTPEPAPEPPALSRGQPLGA